MTSDVLALRPYGSSCGDLCFRVPGSKSITNRALVLAAVFSEEEMVLRNVLFAEDTSVMMDALGTLGVSLDIDEDALEVRVRSGGVERLKETWRGRLFDIEVKNSGTTARFLMGLVGLMGAGSFRFDGTSRMRERPFFDLIHALLQAGAVDVEYEGESGFLPLTLHAKGLRASSISVNTGKSSQFLSGLMMAVSAMDALSVEGFGNKVSWPYVEMTQRMIEDFRVRIRSYDIEGDMSAASYFVALSVVLGQQVRIKSCLQKSIQGDIGFAWVLRDAGLIDVSFCEGDMIVEPKGRSGGIRGDFNKISDTFMSAVAIAPLLSDITLIEGIGHVNDKECLRIEAMAQNLRRLGQEVRCSSDSIEVIPDLDAMRRVTTQRPVRISTFKDHRIAMAFGVLGSYDLHGGQKTWLEIEDPGCVAKTFPDYWRVLEAL